MRLSYQKYATDFLTRTAAKFAVSAKGMVINMEMRVGHGFDVHRVCDGDRLVLGGVAIPCGFSLLGHSDADVLVHAIMDALLGAAALGDIGRHFPDTDDAYRGISSLVLAEKVYKLISADGWNLSNIDATIVAQRPKCSTYIDEMKKNVAPIFSMRLSALNIKATTEEGLGYTGRGEGIAAHAVALLYR